MKTERTERACKRRLTGLATRCTELLPRMPALWCRYCQEKNQPKMIETVEVDSELL